MKRYFTLIALLLLPVLASAQKAKYKKQVLTQISAAMQEQENCWNQGDVRCFMKHYWESDSLQFVGKSGITYGWQQTLDNYLKSYPSKEAMGTLTFTNLRLDFLDKQTVYVIGLWKLVRGGDLSDLSGIYSLIWQPKNGRWVIIMDHSS